MYIAIDLKNNTATAFKDLKTASEEVKSTYKTVKRHLDTFGFYKKNDFRVYFGKYIKSSRGNPLF